MRRVFRVIDIAAIALSLAVVVVFSAYAYGDRGTGTLVQIDAVDGTWVYPLEQERVVTVEGPVGDVIVRIGGGSARVIEADCRDKLCVTMGAISRPGAWVACLPNHVFVRVLGTDAGTDAIAY